MNVAEMLDAVRTLPAGDYAECGVYQGNSALFIAEHMHPAATLRLFDSFKGHAVPSEFDDARVHPRGRYADCSASGMASRLPVGTKFVIYEGWIPDTFDDVSVCDQTFRYVHIDLDHYWPTRHACYFFLLRMVRGGIMRFDDYTSCDCPGATKAVDEVFGRENVLLNDARWVAP